MILASCNSSNPQVESILQQAEALMEDHPDSAFSLLDSLHFKQQLSKKETAHYALLLAKATNKTYRPLLPCDSLLDVSLSYYKKSTPERATALLYKGRLEEELGQTERAIELLQDGLTIIRDFPNVKEIKRLIHSSLGILYEDNKHFEESVSSYREMLSVCEKDKDKAIALSGISDYYIMNDKVDSAFYYANEALKCAIHSQDSILIPQMEHNLALYHYYYSHPDSALLFERKAINHAVNNSKRRLYYGTYGGILYDLDQIDSAIYYLNLSIDTTKYERHRLTTLLNLYQIEKYRGDYEKASHYLEEHVSIIDSLYTEERDTEISNLIHEHKTELRVQDEQARGKRDQIIIIIISAFILLLLLLTLLYYLYKRHKEKKQLNAKLNENVEKLAILHCAMEKNLITLGTLKTEKEQLEKDIRQLLHSQEIQEEYLNDLLQHEQTLLRQIAEREQQIEQSTQQIRHLENWQFTQTKIYQKIKELRKSSEGNELKHTLNNSDCEKLRSVLFSLNKQMVRELKERYPLLQDDDILLYILEQRTDFDTKAIAISLGTTSTHAINQRRYRMKKRMNSYET
ncbi:MAG: hypothetical protein IJL37_01845 [Bacteroidaceae bacterium]|nr:hypothetical protein [Bacteroidaceae bacterium]